MITLRSAPALELADVIRRHASDLTATTSQQRRVLDALAACRTAALGGHVETCEHCQHQRVAYNSCRNRHCPKCRGSACARWMEARAAELLPVEYFHVVFTLPDAFNGLVLANQRVAYGILFVAAAQTLLEVAASPGRLGARIGFVAVLHTWGQNLQLHPHVHCVVPGGGLSRDGTRWIGCRPGFFLPVRVLSRVFRGKFIDLIRKAFKAGRLRGIEKHAFETLIGSTARQDWVVYAKPPFGGPEQVLKYLSRYTHRIAISNGRLVSADDQSVTFNYRDYAHGNRRRTMTLSGGEFLRRFLMHVVPRGFVRIRHYGLLGNRVRTANVRRCRELLNVDASGGEDQAAPRMPGSDTRGDDRHGRCPICGRGRMIRGQPLTPRQLKLVLLRRRDTS
jgi:hypothetical protein